jgi:hypothetical protein
LRSSKRGMLPISPISPIDSNPKLERSMMMMIDFVVQSLRERHRCVWETKFEIGNGLELDSNPMINFDHSSIITWWLKLTGSNHFPSSTNDHDPNKKGETFDWSQVGPRLI